ncbi:MAG: AI-2E family transporter [Alphaproteobacteria bacterium]|nr:AI-2E family transporter [Alphaproteobacteria bacterium]
MNYKEYRWLIWGLIFIAFCIIIHALHSVLLPFVVGITLGYLFDPLASYFEKKGLNRTIATLLVLGLAILVFIPIIILFITLINEQLSTFIGALPQYVSSFTKKIEPLINELQTRFPDINAEKIKASIRASVADNFKIAGGVLHSLLNKSFALINLISLLLITPIVTFYMLRDWDNFTKKVNSLLPRKSKKSIRIAAKEIDKTLSGFIRGQISVCILLGIYYSLGLYLIGLDLGLIIGFTAGLISFIPYVGSISGFILSIILALAQFDNFMPVFQVILVFVTGQFIEGNFLTPKLVGDKVGLHPVWIMFALLSGGVLLGFLGLLIAIPAAAVIGVLTRHAINNYKQSSLYLED